MSKLFDEIDKFLYRKARVPDEASQCSGIKDPMVRDRKNRPHAFFFHNDMRACFSYKPASFREGFDSFPSGDVTGNLGHLDCNLGENFFFMRGSVSFGAVVKNLKAGFYRVFYIVDSLFNCFALRYAPGNSRTLNDISRDIAFFDNNFVCHRNHPFSFLLKNYTPLMSRRQGSGQV